MWRIELVAAARAVGFLIMRDSPTLWRRYFVAAMCEDFLTFGQQRAYMGSCRGACILMIT